MSSWNFPEDCVHVQALERPLPWAAVWMTTGRSMALFSCLEPFSGATFWVPAVDLCRPLVPRLLRSLAHPVLLQT